MTQVELAEADTATDDLSHQIISSYFIGPRAENLGYFRKNIDTILTQLGKTREAYYPQDKDKPFITPAMQKTPGFEESMKRLEAAVETTSKILGKTSIPFWSPRYEAHMCTDLSMASLLGYFMTMLYNPNNVALEASPLSTVAEIEVGEQLCELFGYNIHPENVNQPVGWGHVTCDGTVANLESIWVARNLKFYPLSLRWAMDEGPLDFLADRFYVETCDGEQRLFSSLSTWQLLNLKPADVLDLPDRLTQEHGVSNKFISDTLEKYTIQSTGKEKLEKKFGMEQPCQYMLSKTRHYSWPKGAAIAGIGSDNVIGIEVDNAARVDIEDLKTQLEENLKAERPVLAVVAIIGSTEEGAVDPLGSILALRKQFQARGLSFMVHADAAWGGYFASMLPQDYTPGDVTNLPTEMGKGSGFVPDACLRAETQDDLYALRFADSITVDPHKAGYIPYPAGGLCYRDARLRFLVTWTSPYLSRGSVTSIGIYGVEGSKPGASAMSAWLSNKTIGLDQKGYGSLMSEVTWTCTRLSAEWASIDVDSELFTCVPFNQLPSELAPGSTPQKVQAEKRRIKREIVGRTNAQIMEADAGVRDADRKAIRLMRDLGSDLNINAFALNFRYSNGRVNRDVEEANYLMQRVVRAFSVESPADDPTRIPLFLTSTMFSNELYGGCKEHFMRRLQLDQSNQDLMVLRNVVMSPFPTDGNFIRELAEIFQDRVEKETEVVRRRNEISEDFHKFLLQGTEQIYLIHLPMFHVANHRQQLIVAADLDPESLETYRRLKKANPAEPMILVTQHKTVLKDIIAADGHGQFVGQVMTKDSGMILRDVKVKITSTVVSKPLNSQYRLKSYPKHFMPFYLYGTPNEANIDHVIVRAPNTQLSAGRCTLDVPGMTEAHWGGPLLLMLEDVREAPMQPFPSNEEIGARNGAVIAHEHLEQANLPPPTPAPAVQGEEGPATDDAPAAEDGQTAEEAAPAADNASDASSDSGGDPLDLAHSKPEEEGGLAAHKGQAVVTSETRTGRAGRGSGFFFRPRAAFRVSVWEDGKKRGRPTARHSVPGQSGRLVGRGTIRLGESVYVDSEGMNFDPFARAEPVNEWRHEFDQIGRKMAEA